MTRGPLQAGEPVLLIDHRGRRYLIRLTAGGQFHYHNGVVAHDDVIGLQPGTTFYSSLNGRLRAWRPTLADYILKMPRRAQVIYPKDIGPILMRADVFPGARVLEAGAGSGALTLALLRAVGPAGCVVSYEARADHAEKARQNVAAWMGEDATGHELRDGDITEGVPEEEWFDRVVLDLPEPWATLPAVTPALAPGGLLLSYVPTVPQIERTVIALSDHGYARIETLEVLERGWNIDGQSVRPNHRMVAHTGFLTTAFKLHGPSK